MYAIFLLTLTIGQIEINDFRAKGCIFKHNTYYCYEVVLSQPEYDLNVGWMISYCSKINDLLVLDHFCKEGEEYYNCRYVFRGMNDFIEDSSNYQLRRRKYCRSYIDERHMDEDDDY
jgi:hypothetical protein